MPSTRSQRGQGTVEYVAIIALVALVLAAAVAGAAGLGPGIGNAVVGQVRHALCIVAARACEEQVAERPCVVRTARDERRESVSLGFVQLGAGRVVLRERLSDGTLRLTVLHRGRAGVTAGFGSSTRVRVGGVEVDVGAHAQGTVAGLVGGGQVFEVRTAAEADAIVRRLRAEGSPTLDAVRRLVRRGGQDAGGGRDARRGRVRRGRRLRAVGGRGEGRRERRRRERARPPRGPADGGDDVVPAPGSRAARVRRRDAGGRVRRAGRGRAALRDDGPRRAIPRSWPRSSAGMRRRARRCRPARASPPARRGGRPRRASASTILRSRPRCARGASSPASGEAVLGLGRALRDRARIDVRRYAREASSDGDGVDAGMGVRAGVRMGPRPGGDAPAQRGDATARRPVGAASGLRGVM